MGRGDKRTRRGKIAAKSFGKTRPRKKSVKKTVTEKANGKTEAKETA